MAELLCCTYIPQKTHISKMCNRNIKECEKKGFVVKKLSEDLLAIKSPPKLELVFRKEERDFIFDMIDDVCHYFGKRNLSEEDVYAFVSKIISGEIRVSISSDGSYMISM